LADPIYYVVGLPQFIQDVVGTLRRAMAVPESRILWEPFRGY
jgi:hypothetical protein